MCLTDCQCLKSTGMSFFVQDVMFGEVMQAAWAGAVMVIQRPAQELVPLHEDQRAGGPPSRENSSIRITV